MDFQHLFSFSNLVAIINICSCLFIMYFLRGILQYLNTKNDIRKYEIDMNSPITWKETSDELDDFINGTWDEYYVLNIGWQKNIIINSERQQEITMEITDIVASRISPLLISKLSRYYSNVKNSDGISAVDTVIAERVHMKVLAFCIDNHMQ